MLVANANGKKVVLRSKNDVDHGKRRNCAVDEYWKRLALKLAGDNCNKFLRIDVWIPCHVRHQLGFGI